MHDDPDRQHQHPRPPAPWPVSIWLGLIGATAVLYGVGLGTLDLWAPDEPRYAAIAEQLRSGRHGPSGGILLHLNDAPYSQKPPLYFWLAAAIGRPLGHVTEWAARLPSALAGVVSVALTAWVGRRLLGGGVAPILAAGFLATSFRFVWSARRVQLDVLLTSLELVAIALFVALEFRRSHERKAPHDRSRRPVAAIAGIHAALGAAALVKGPVAWLPLAVIAVYLIGVGRASDFRAIAPAWAWPLSLGPLAVWASAAVLLAPPGFAEVAISDNLLGRFFAGTAHARPFYYYAYQLPLDFLPWSLGLPIWLLLSRHKPNAAGPPSDPARADEDARAVRLLSSWIGVALVFFTLSAGKRGLYLLPIFPALALLLAWPFRALSLEAARRNPLIRRTGGVIALVALIELLLATLVAPRLEAEKSPRPIAERATALTDENERIGVYRLEPLEGALAYYGGREITPLSDEAGLARFLATGGRIVLLRARHFDDLGAELGLESLARFRSGARQLTLATTRFALDQAIPLGD